tara:strand:- start:1932 stop:2888 length:957 start_codon:yes stop_codon:yes gene_type:complete
MKLPSIKINFLTIFIILFPLITSLGFYGYGLDFINSYYKNPISLGSNHFIGWNIAATMMGPIALGPFIVSLFLPLSIYFLIKEHLHKNKEFNKSLVNFSFVFLTHNWAVILPILNAIKQGLATGPFYLIILLLDKLNKRKQKFKILIIILLSLTLNYLHKLGTLFFVILLLSFLILSIKKNQRRISLITSSILITISLIYFYGIGNISTRIIGFDLRLPFIIFAVSYCLFILLFKKKEFLEKYIFIVPFYMNIFSIAFCFLGYNLEFERLQMTVFIPQYIAILSLIKGQNKYIVLLTTSVILFILTVFVGVFRSFQTL